jgi:transcription-repair coupling factor (superfamily II helicase)
MTLTAPKINHNPFHWHGLTGASLGFALAQLMPNRQTPLLVITPDAMTSQHLAEELRFFLSDAQAVSLLPDWETLPYDAFSPHQDIISERLKSLYQLATHPPAVLIAQVSTLMHRLMPAKALLSKSLLLSCGDQVSMQSLAEQLTQAGYQRVNQVMEHGEFAIRGALLDLYPMGSEQPLRIDWLDDDVDSIRRFDVSTQRSLDKIANIALLPAKEYALDEAGIVQFRQSWREHFPDVHHNHRLYQTVSQGQMIGGLEYYLPLFYPELSSIGDYLLPNMRVGWVEDIAQASQTFWQEIQSNFIYLWYFIVNFLVFTKEKI